MQSRQRHMTIALTANMIRCEQATNAKSSQVFLTAFPLVFPTVWHPIFRCSSKLDHPGKLRISILKEHEQQGAELLADHSPGDTAAVAAAAARSHPAAARTAAVRLEELDGRKRAVDHTRAVDRTQVEADHGLGTRTAAVAAAASNRILAAGNRRRRRHHLRRPRQHMGAEGPLQ
jgi:hypothetical protein